MDATSTDHPLRLDPLNTLPDAISVPRRPRPRISPPSTPPPRSTTSSTSSHPTPLSFPPSVSEQRLIESQAAALLNSGRDDPLLREVVARAKHPASPPAGNAYATDVDDLLQRLDDALQDHHVDVAAGIVDRSDVTLFEADAERGGGAGVYVVKSRKNWRFAPAWQPGGSPGGEEYYFVRRSLADFVWLEQRLTARYEGVIVPPLPAMTLAGRMKHGYMYQPERLRGLQRFLRRVATHAVLSTGDEVMAFLGATGEDMWAKMRREVISHENSITSALFGGRRGANALERVGLWGEKFLWQAGRKVNKSLVWFLERDSVVVRARADSAEARLDRLQTYVKELGVSLAAVRQAAGRVAANRGRDIRAVVGMQQALRMFGQREGGKFGGYLEGIVLDIGGAHEENRSDANGYVAGMPVVRVMDEVFRDYEERARGAQRIMNARKEEQDAYEHALAVYTKLRDRLESRTGSMWETGPSGNTLPSSGEGLEELVNDVSVASARLAEVRRHYQSVALSTTDELRRLRSDMHEDLSRALQGMAEELAREHAAHARAWARLAEILAECRDVSGGRR